MLALEHLFPSGCTQYFFQFSFSNVLLFANVQDKVKFGVYSIVVLLSYPPDELVYHLWKLGEAEMLISNNTAVL